jgi:hypothetical protein
MSYNFRSSLSDKTDHASDMAAISEDALSLKVVAVSGCTRRTAFRYASRICESVAVSATPRTL